jgi:hypothetical protein
MFMQVIGRFVFLGLQSFHGKKDPNKTYFNLSLLQGQEVFKVFLDDGQEKLFEEAQQYDEYEIECAVFLKTDRGVPVLGLRLLKVIPITTGEVIDLAPEIAGKNTKGKKVESA